MGLVQLCLDVDRQSFVRWQSATNEGEFLLNPMFHGEMHLSHQMASLNSPYRRELFEQSFLDSSGW